MEEIIIRPAHPGDEEILAYIQSQSWKAAFSAILPAEKLADLTQMDRTIAMYQRVLRNPGIYLLIEEVDGKAHCIAAWSKNRCGLDDSTAELICIHSLQERWHKGYGSKMMEYVLSDMKAAAFSAVILWVFEENHRARSFYEKHGFALCEQRQNSFDAVEVQYRRTL